MKCGTSNKGHVWEHTPVPLVVNHRWVWQWEELPVRRLPVEIKRSEVIKRTVLSIEHLHFQIKVLATEHWKLEG